MFNIFLSLLENIIWLLSNNYKGLQKILSYLITFTIYSILEVVVLNNKIFSLALIIIKSSESNIDLPNSYLVSIDFKH